MKCKRCREDFNMWTEMMSLNTLTSEGKKKGTPNNPYKEDYCLPCYRIEVLNRQALGLPL